MKYAIICLMIFLTGCSTLETYPIIDIISKATTVKTVLEETKPITEDAHEEEKYYDSNHNWNGSEVVVQKVEKKKPEVNQQEIVGEVEEVEEQPLRLPWPLLIIFLLSGGLYLANTIRYKLLMRKEK